MAFGPSYSWDYRQLVPCRVSYIGIHTSTCPAATIPTLLVFAFQLKFAANHTSTKIGACAEEFASAHS